MGEVAIVLLGYLAGLLSWQKSSFVYSNSAFNYKPENMHLFIRHIDFHLNILQDPMMHMSIYKWYVKVSVYVLVSHSFGIKMFINQGVFLGFSSPKQKIKTQSNNEQSGLNRIVQIHREINNSIQEAQLSLPIKITRKWLIAYCK